MPLFDIRSPQGHYFEWQQQVHKSYAGLLLPQAELHALHGGYGNMVFQKIERPNYDIWFSNYEIKKLLHTHSRADVPLIELSLLLQNNIAYHMPLGRIRHKQWQFNLMYSLAMDSKAQFDKDCFYTTLDFHAKEHFLDALMAIYPDLLGPFIEAVRNGREVFFYEQHLFASLQMLQTSQLITHLITQARINTVLLDLCVTILFGFAISCKLEMAGSQYRYDRKQEMEYRLKGVLANILSDLTKFAGIASYARQAGMSTTALKQNFKDYHGSTLKETWDKERLSRCFIEVVSTNKSFDEIALDYGFSDGAAFSKAFKRRFHFPPIFFRKTVS